MGKQKGQETEDKQEEEEENGEAERAGDRG